MFDTHSHAVAADLIDILDREGSAFGVAIREEAGGRRRAILGDVAAGLPFMPALSDAAGRAAWSTNAGVDRQVVSGWMDLAGYHLPPTAGAWLSRVQNETLAEELRSVGPGRLVGAAAVPLQDPAAAVAELRYAARDLGFRAVQVGTSVRGMGLDDPTLGPFWSEVEALDMGLVVHPVELEVPERLRRYFMQILVGNPTETTIAAAALILGGVLDRHPGLRVLLVHGGGFLPYQLGRLVRGFTAAPSIARPVSQFSADRYMSNFYFDTVLHDARAVEFLVDIVGASQVVIGTDFPFPMQESEPARLLASVDITTAEREAIADINATRWLGLPI